MTLTTSDINLVMTGSGTTANPNASLGGAPATAEAISSTSLNSVFDNITGDESTAGDTEYRVLAIYNSSTTDMASDVKVYVPTNYQSFISIGVNQLAGVNPPTITNESTAPSGVTFSNPTTKAAAVNVGDINAGSFRALYVRRVIPVSTTTPKDSALFRITVDATTET